MTYEDLVHLEKDAARAVHRLEDAARVIADECCSHLDDVEEEVASALVAAKAVHTKIAVAMLDQLRAETRVA